MKRPSPATVISMIALVFAMTGTAFAAVNYARNAGAVDGKSAVADGASTKSAAGRLVATRRSGLFRGTIASKYIDPLIMRGVTGTFGRSYEVQDNQVLAPVPIGTIPGLGTLTASCLDQDQTAGQEDPSTNLVFANQSGDIVNISRTIGGGNPTVTAIANGTQHAFTISGSNTFELHVERKGTNYLARGVVRQDGRGTAAASCLVYGFALAVAG
jgi:hypothetical protein